MNSILFRLDLTCELNGLSKKNNSFISDIVENIKDLNKEKLLNSNSHEFMEDVAGLCCMKLQGKEYTPLCGYINQEVN